ncbi:MAG: hypothetical protein QOG14_3364 [Mycobacterium sp.]|nr:hypothetical protein [Mycobacterium sp.]
MTATTATADTALLEDVLGDTETVIRGTRPDQYGLPTPCPEYDVGTLVNHLVGWLRVFAAGAAGETPDEDPYAYKTGEHPADVFHDAAQRAVEAFRNGAADKSINLGHGDSPGSMIFGMMLMEYIGHGWDLATATGQPASYSDKAVAAAQAAGASTLKPEYRGAGQTFGDAVSVGASATPLERLIGFLGRDPRWRRGNQAATS